MTPYIGALVDPVGLFRSFDSARARFDALLFEALQRTVNMAAMYAKTSTLYRSHTYGLRGSIKGFVIGGMGGGAGGVSILQGRVEARAPYAAFVENGTRPHIIVPRRKNALRFVQNGAVRFAPFVQHPGTRRRPFMREARDLTAPIFERLVGEAFVRAFA